MAGMRLEAIDLHANPYKTILRLAVPTVIAMLAQSAVNEVDLIFFKHLPAPIDSNGQAALMPSLILVWLVGGSLSAVSVGTQALAARRFAEGDRRGAGAVLTNAAFFCLVAGAIATLFSFFFVPYRLSHQGLTKEVLEIAIPYSRWRTMGIISMAMTMAIKAFFDGIGRTSVHLVASVIMNAFNVLFCWIFIFGHWGAPQLGPVGAGMSAFLATWIGLFIMIGYSWVLEWGSKVERERTFALYQWRTLSRRLVWDILKLSIPAGLATAVMMGGFSLFSQIVAELDRGRSGEAVYGAATMDIVGVLKLTFTACIGFGTTTATMVGQALGMKRPADAERFGWASVRLGIVLFGVIGLCEGVFFTPQIVHLISDSSGVESVAIVPLRMIGLITPIIAVAMILSEALFGAGSPVFVAVTQFILVFFVLLPLSYVLAVKFDLRLIGIWSSACVYAVLAAIAMTVRFRQGKWKTVKL